MTHANYHFSYSLATNYLTFMEHLTLHHTTPISFSVAQSHLPPRSPVGHTVPCRVAANNLVNPTPAPLFRPIDLASQLGLPPLPTSPPMEGQGLMPPALPTSLSVAWLRQATRTAAAAAAAAAASGGGGGGAKRGEWKGRARRGRESVSPAVG